MLPCEFVPFTTNALLLTSFTSKHIQSLGSAIKHIAFLKCASKLISSFFNYSAGKSVGRNSQVSRKKTAVAIMELATKCSSKLLLPE